MSSRVMFEKSLREIARDRAGLALTLLTAPVFVILYALVLQPASPAVVGVDDAAWQSILEPEFDVVTSDDLERDVRSGRITFGVRRDEGLQIIGDGTEHTFVVELPRLQALLTASEASRIGQDVIPIRVETIGRSGDRTAFDRYVPNLLVFALIMLVFSSALPVARESERGTLDRLRTTLVTPAQVLVGMTAAQLLLGLVAMLLTLGVAMALGFEASGSIAIVTAIGALTGLACVAMGVLVAGLAKNVMQAFLVASVCMFFLVLFSGLVFPVPDFVLLQLLPTVHAVEALSEVLNLGAGLADIQTSLLKLIVLSLLFFAIGWLRFSRLHTNHLTRRS